MTLTPVRLQAAESADLSRVVVEWIMTSVCSYSCTYCPAYLHDGRVRWPGYEDISRFCQRVRAHYQRRPLTFLLSGGEITLYPHLPRLARELRSMAIDVVILSNGDRPIPWWHEHGSLFDEVLLSYHHESADPDRFVETVQLLATMTKVQANIVIDPAAFEKTMRLAQRIEDETTALAHRKIMFLDGWKRTAQYTDQQHAELTAALAAEAARSIALGGHSLLKGDLRVEFSDGSHQRATPTQIIDAGWNRWEGWTCAVGTETLFVRFDEIWRASCREGGRIGSIFDTELGLPEAPVLCRAASCNCIAGIKTSKAAQHLALPSATS